MSNYITVELTSKRPTQAEAASLPGRYERRPLEAWQKRRRFLYILKVFAMMVVGGLVMCMGVWFVARHMDATKGFWVQLPVLAAVGGFIACIAGAAGFCVALIPPPSLAPKSPKRLAKNLLFYMMDGCKDKHGGYDDQNMIDEFTRVIPQGAGIYEGQIREYVSLNNLMWQYLYPHINKGRRIRRTAKIKVGEAKELFPDVYRVNAFASGVYQARHRVSRRNTVTIYITDFAVTASFVFVKSGDRYFNYDYAPKLEGNSSDFVNLVKIAASNYTDLEQALEADRTIKEWSRLNESVLEMNKEMNNSMLERQRKQFQELSGREER